MSDILKNMTEQEIASITELLKQTADNDLGKALAAQTAFAAALSGPIREGILTGNILNGIFSVDNYETDASVVEYPIDFYRPDNAGDYVAVTLPAEGKVPGRTIEGDYVNVPVFTIGHGIEWRLKYARNARWNIMGRALEVLEAGFIKKMNDDGWHTILAAGENRNVVVSDANAAIGQFTKRLVSAMKLVMRRNAGGNSTSMNRGKLTHLYVSPEAIEDIRNWGIDQIDELTRREIYVASDDSINNVFGVSLVDLDELGDGQEYQDYYENAGILNGTMGASDVEIVVGLDLSKNDSFVMPVSQKVMISPDPTLHRNQMAGFYGTADVGYGVLNNARVLIGSF